MNNNSEALQIRRRMRKPAMPELKSLIGDTPNFEEWDIYLALGGTRNEPRATPFDMRWSIEDLIDDGYTHFLKFPKLPQVMRDPNQRKFAQILSAIQSSMSRPGVHKKEVEEACARVWVEAEQHFAGPKDNGR